MSEKEKYPDHKRLLKELVKKVFGFKTIEYSNIKHELSIYVQGAGLITKFSPETETYINHFKTIFTYTLCSYIDKPVLLKGIKLHDENDKNNFLKDEYIDLVMSVLKSFIGGKEMEEILTISVRDNLSHQKRYIPTTASIFDVMENYSNYSGTPLLCTEEQLPACKAKFEGMYAFKSETGDSAPDEKELSLSDFFHKHPDVVKKSGEKLCNHLINVMNDVFSKVDISKEELEEEYNSACKRIKGELTEWFESEVRKIICTNQNDDIKRIVIVDQNCPIENLKKLILYYPDCVPVLSDWKTPVHEYRRYTPPTFSSEERADVLMHPTRQNSVHFPISELQYEKESEAFPISSKTIPYSQSMFYDFQIQYMTAEETFQSDGLFIIANVDIYIREEIKRRWPEQVNQHWRAVIDSINDILSRVTSIDFIPLINETPTDTPSELETILAKLNQCAAVKRAEKTFSAFLPQEMIQRHFFICDLDSGYTRLFGEDFIEQFQIQQVAYVLIPLIGSFVSELNRNLYAIASEAGDIMTKNAFNVHVQRLEKYLKSADLDTAIQAWDEAYTTRKKCELQQKRRSVQQGIDLYPNYRQLALVEYTDRNGNLIRNLKSVLEKYLYCLKTPI